MTSRLVAAALGCVALLAATPPFARAAAPPDAPPPAAVERPVQDVIDAAKAAFEDGRYEEAFAGFEEAQKRTGQVGIFYPIARCYEELDRLEEALAAYERVAAAESVPAAARGKADTAARLLRDRLATGRLVLQVSPFGATVLVDGAVVGTAPVEPLDVAPGKHTVAVRRVGFSTMTRDVDVQGARTATVVVELAAAVEKPVEPPDDGASFWPWVTLGVGGAVSIGGAISVWSGEQDHLEITQAEGYSEGQLVDMSRDRALALEASGDDKKLVGWILVGVGSAVMVGSAVWLALDAPPEGEGTTVVPTASVTPGGAALGAVGRF
ncbi:MAG: PEGA domain-containing protein [Deltaproteobacteria bacterium]|nr:MAG: PEGA domain-containing protein [Deltaproteobacteria bacterium]